MLRGEEEEERQREGAKEAAAAARFGERVSTVEVRDGREKRGEKSDGKPECNVFFSKKAPCYVSRLHSHESHKTAKRKAKKREKEKNQQCSAGV